MPERGAAAIDIRSSHSLRGSSTTSMRSIRRSVCEIFEACFSEVWPRKCLTCLSGSDAFFRALRTPFSTHCFCVCIRAVSSPRLSAYSS